jgi:ATP synthase in type III secretion protein N
MKNNVSLEERLAGYSTRDKELIASFAQRLTNITPIRKVGYVDEIIVSTVRANLPDISQGELCEIETSQGDKILGEVIAFTGHRATITCLESIVGVRLGAKVTPLGKSHSVKSHFGLFSKVLDGMGRKMGDYADKRGGALSFDHDSIPIMREAPLAIDRPPVQDILETGVRVIDSMLTLAEGQRLGVFAPPGCGKSTLIAQIARGAKTDAIVFGLVGERGRELREFIEHEISDDLRKRCIFVCSTSDRSPIERVRAAFTATSIAEHLRDQGKSVLLLIDSITRLARAQREVGLMAGEPIGQTGFTPSVYTILPELIERAGKTSKGCITAIYTVLMEKDRLEDDPIASEAKSLLDGHIVLSSKLVEKSHFPAIDPLRSLSRVMDRIAESPNINAASLARRAISLYDEIELLIRLNEYEKGSDPLVDEAIRIRPALAEWAKQAKSEFTSMEDSNKKLSAIVSQFGTLVKKVA